MDLRIQWIVLATVLLTTAGTGVAAEPDAAKLVTDSLNYMRGKASVATIKMTIQRPDWRREMLMRAWSKGETDSLIRIVEPPGDEGNGTLKKGREMWTYNPKVNRVIKLPPSMMAQSWLGSDFSNNDLAKSDSILHDYVHTIEGTETHEGIRIYRVKSMPKPAAPVVWGMQKLIIREDGILLNQVFYDEELKPVKEMSSLEIQMMGGKLFPQFLKMRKTDAEGEFTLLEYQSIEFKDDLPDNIFTRSSLSTYRR